MEGFWDTLMWIMAWLPAAVTIRVAGLVIGFGLAAGLKNTRLRRPAIAVGEAINLASLALAALLPVLTVLGGLIIGIYWVTSSTRGTAGSALIIGAIATAVIAPIYLGLMVFTADQTPRDIV